MFAWGYAAAQEPPVAASEARMGACVEVMDPGGPVLRGEIGYGVLIFFF